MLVDRRSGWITASYLRVTVAKGKRCVVFEGGRTEYRFDATAVRSVSDNHLHLGVALYEARDISAGLTYNLDPREAL